MMVEDTDLSAIAKATILVVWPPVTISSTIGPPPQAAPLAEPPVRSADTVALKCFFSERNEFHIHKNVPKKE